VTVKTITVDVQWALQGKGLDRAGRRVLACSDGALNEENFDQIIERFTLGTPDKGDLPQVTVSYLTSGSGEDREYYLGMAIHQWGADIQTNGDQLFARDKDSRPVVVTAYYCVPYREPAGIVVSYQGMYDRFKGVWPGTVSGPPLTVELPARSALPLPDPLARQAASRLLSGRPVCVLEAGQTTVEERLAFIEAVTQLIPYGFRTRLTASTWVRATQRDHKFRLFFSAAKRDGDQDDVVYWGQPDRSPLTPRNNFAYEYNQWLDGTVGQLDRLAKMTAPRTFAEQDLQQALDTVLNLPAKAPVSKKADSKRASFSLLPAMSQSPATLTPEPEPEPEPQLTGRGAEVEQLLRECATYARTPVQVPQLNTAATRLMNQGRSRKVSTPEERIRHRQIIREEHLFRHIPASNAQAMLRRALLRIAFTAPLTYGDYCLIEDSSLVEGIHRAQQPEIDLIHMIMDTGLAESDLRIMAVVYAQPPGEETRRLLDKWYKSDRSLVFALIQAAGGSWHRRRHAALACEIVLDCLERSRCDADQVRDLLHRHSYLAHLIQAQCDDDLQVRMLATFLAKAYPEPLTELDIQKILTNSQHPPSPALLGAVLLRIPEQNLRLAQLAREAYVYSTVTSLKLVSEQDFRALQLRVEFPGGGLMTDMAQA